MTRTSIELALKRGQSVALPPGEDRKVEAREGALWITPGDGSDIVLEAGGRVCIGAYGRAIVTALGATARARIDGEADFELVA